MPDSPDTPEIPDTLETIEDLAAHAHSTHVVVIGAGIAGLVAAYECAKVGMPVTLLEAGDEIGGTIGAAQLDGLEVGVGATGWSSRGSEVRALVDELGLGGDVVALSGREWIAGLPGAGAAPLPHETVLGIPANPWDPSVRPFIGVAGAWRAYLDRLRPPLTIGAQHDLDKLVRSRMGDAVADRLVAPLSIDGYGLAPADIDVTVAAPGLSSALTRTGSLGGAVADLLVDGQADAATAASAAAGSTAQTLQGGLRRLVDELHARLVDLGARIETDACAVGLERAEDGRWIVSVERAVDLDDAPDPGPADVVIVATAEAEARGLLPVAVARGAAPTLREVVTLVVDAPALSGTAGDARAVVHAVPGSHRATGLVVDTLRRADLAEAAAPGRHVVRVSFGARGAAPATAVLDDAAARDLARDEASALLGITIGPREVRAWRRDRFALAEPASARGHADRAEAVRAEVAREAGLAVVGAWVSGSGIAAVVADAMEEAERVRRGALWGTAARE